MVFVPTGTKTDYQTADTWKDFLMIEEGAETMSATAVKAEKRNTHSIYSLDGKRLNSLRKELNIIRMSDGTVKKVMVK